MAVVPDKARTSRPPRLIVTAAEHAKIKAAFDQMASDPEYQALARAIDREFAGASSEALQKAASAPR